jgi:hypothetical protein
VIVEFATFGSATFLAGAVFGAFATGIGAAYSLENYLNLENAAKANVSDSTALVDKATVIESGKETLERAAAFITVMTQVGGRVSQALADKRVQDTSAGPKTSGGGKGMWKLTEVEAHLQRTEEGRNALSIMRQNNVNVVYNDEGKTGTYHIPNKRTIVLSRYLNSEDASLALIHELGHSDWHVSGASATRQIRSMGRDQYISAKCMEEAAVQSRAIRAKFEANRGGDFKGSTPLEDVYGKAAGAKMQQVRAQSPNLAEPLVNEQGRFAGELAVYRAFRNGEVVTSTGKVTYPEKLGADWDRANGVK